MSPAAASTTTGECSSSQSPVYTNAYLQKRERSIKEVVGFLSEEFNCSHNNYRGALFVGSEGVLFEGFLFFFQQKVVALKWVHVVRIDKTEHSITIVAKKKDEETYYEFKSIQNAERLWSTLMSLYHETLTGTPRARSNSFQARIPLRRNLSDPLPEMHEDAMDMDDDVSESEQDYPAASGVPTIRSSSNVSSAFRSIKSLPTFRSDSDVPEDSDSANTEPQSRDSMTSKEEWDDVVAESNTSFSVCVLKNVELDCDLDTFVEKFLANDAQDSIPSYMQKMGDKDVVVSPWRSCMDDVSNNRTIEYSHPVNAPLAPPMARAKKEQQYRRYGDYGLVVTTETHVQDVPMTDCFFVIDQILVESTDNEESLKLTTVFDIRFVKNTMFRSIIANTTRSEFQEWFEGLGDVMCTALGGAPTGAALAEKSTEGLAPPSPISTNLLVGLALALLVLILLLQVYIILEIKILKASQLSLISQVCS